ncbi:MAG: D-alanyl-D-alanine carboxypeptidase/D-alanyl-D-alanine-endopeptidase [Candidatus Brocadiaceae bacterium]|nr:D-alanyl-D-alanine carboxypeptidase/D-alanyl-D-alanine-endopeptidase [Candidatus Brocadiaceae bacterium]
MNKATFFLLIPLFFMFNSTVWGKSGIQDVVCGYQSLAALRHAQWGVYAEYADTGDTIVSLNDDKSLAPASVLKVITTGSSLVSLGKNFRFKTALYYDGEISEKGVLQGNIYVVGGGDPTLGSDQVPGSLALDELMKVWVDAVKKKGILRINGKLVADATLFDEKTIPDFWYWGDVGNYYGAGTSALCIHDNLYYLSFKPGKHVGDRARVLRMRPTIAGLEFNNSMRTGKVGSGDQGYIYCAPGQYLATLRGSIPAGSNEFTIKGSMPDPPLFTVQYLTEILKESGIPVSSQAGRQIHSQKYHDEKLLHMTYSPILSHIVEITNKRSMNLYAEQLLKMVAFQETGEGNTKNGVTVIKKLLGSFGIESDGFTIYDGSGLSRSNMATAKVVAQFLSAMHKQKLFDVFYRSFSIAGDPETTGSVRNFGIGTPVALNARMKTGYMTGVRSHSGYIRTRSGRLVAFSLLCNNFSTSLREINKIHKDVLVQLAMLP